MVLSSLYLFLCAAYLLLLAWAPPQLAAALKVLPILLLIARAASPRCAPRIYLALGLVSSLAGDLILALSPDSLFVQGVAAFLVAHLLYVAAFRPSMHYSTRGCFFAAVVVAWCAGVGVAVIPRLGALQAPVVAYMVVITAMGVCAAFATGARATLFAGAFAFIISDSVIAVDRFVAPFHYAPYVVMTTYYFGQFFIVEGVRRRSSKDLGGHFTKPVSKTTNL